MSAIETFSFLISKLERIKRIIQEQSYKNYEIDNPLLDSILIQCSSLNKCLDILEFQDFPPRSIRNLIKDANNNNIHSNSSSDSENKNKKIQNKNNNIISDTPNPDDFFDEKSERNKKVILNKIAEDNNKRIFKEYNFEDIEEQNYKFKDEGETGESKEGDLDVFQQININSARKNILNLNYSDPKIKTLCIPNYSKIAYVLEKEDAIELWSLLLQLGVEGDIKGKSGAVKRKHNSRIRSKLEKIDNKYAKFLN